MDAAPSISASSGPAPREFPPLPGPRLGLLVLDTRFPRLPGDLGRADSWPVPVALRMVAGAVPARVVRPAAGADLAALLPPFVEAARALQADGVQAIATSCGFLVLAQQALQAAVQVPVVTSSLLQLPALLRQERQVGVLTVDAQALGQAHLRCAGVPADRLADVVVQGVDPQGHFAAQILGNAPTLDPQQAAADVVQAARALQRRCPGLRTLVLECTNMPPCRQQLEAATGLRVLSLLDSPVLGAAFGGRIGA